jgi:DNA-binding SARP family transcriptional activator
VGLVLFVSEVRVIGVRVLGPLQVTVDDVPADVGGPRQRCVLARLIAEHGRVVSADRLIEDLYAGAAPPQALAAVQSYVSHLRRALEPGRPARAVSGVLVTSPPGYAIQLGQDAVDAWSFEDEIHQAAGLDDPSAVQNRLSPALASWRGTAFQEFGGMPWADLEASRLEELRLMATERLANAALQLGQAAQAVADLDRLTAEHPLREEAWRLLALALYQSGRQGDALSALRRARARLAADLGVDPGPALRELESDILAQAPRLSAPSALSHNSAAAVPAPAGTDAAPAIAALYAGQEAELTQVGRSAREAAAGRMQIVLVSGDAGSGKTALAGRVSQRLAGEGWTVTAVRCPEDEGAPAGWLWAEVLRRLAAAAPAEPQALAALLTSTPAGDGDPAAARFRLYRAVVGYLEAVSRAAPLLLVLDDLHRADGETLAFLADVTADLAAARLLVLATYRPAEAGRQLSGCLAALAPREPVRVNLAGLEADAAGALIQAASTRPVDEQAGRAMAERTGVPGTPGAGRRGNPRGRHAQTRKPRAGWVPTAERFRDPSSGVIMRVWIDQSDESRHYIPDGASTPL